MNIHHRPTAFAAMLLLSVAFLLPSVASSKPPGTDGNASFPEAKDSWSPDGRFVLKDVDDPEDPKTPHSIFLTDMQTGKRMLLFSFARKADLLWSPGSNAVAVNDWATNDETQCIVFVLEAQPMRIDLREEFLKSHRPDREKKLATDRRRFDHNYAHAIRWLDAHTLLFGIDGHSSDRKRKFALEYEYKLGDSFHLRKRTID